jgi:hypothetical protein
MAFEKIDNPTFSIKLPSTGKNVRFRPFLVREQKILLLAQNSEDSNEVYSSVKQVITNCCVDENADIEKLTVFDIEYIFLKLRINSISPELILYFEGIEGSDCPECSKMREVKVDINGAEVVFPEESKEDKIFFDDSKTTGMKLRWPDLAIFDNIQKAQNEDDLESVLSLFWSCIEYTFDGDKVYTKDDMTAKEGVEWIESLPVSVFEKLAAFFKNLPQLQQTVPIKCSKCDFEDSFTIRGLDSFFA